MSTFSLLAIPFGGLALIMLALAAVKKQKNLSYCRLCIDDLIGCKCRNRNDFRLTKECFI